jgi:hypothetical protein
MMEQAFYKGVSEFVQSINVKKTGQIFDPGGNV